MQVLTQAQSEDCWSPSKVPWVADVFRNRAVLFGNLYSETNAVVFGNFYSETKANWATMWIWQRVSPINGDHLVHAQLLLLHQTVSENAVPVPFLQIFSSRKLPIPSQFSALVAGLPCPTRLFFSVQRLHGFRQVVTHIQSQQKDEL